jgi:ClpP class serine protease
MDIKGRIINYQAVEKFRGRPLIVYATSTRPGVPAKIAGDAVREFIDQIEQIPDAITAIDVLIHSTGGDALAAWKLMSVLRERFKTVAVLVPYMAFSAATIFSLGADEIVMHPHSSLGPIDPQITVRLGDGKQRQFAFEDVGAFLRFLSEEIGITEQTHITAIVDKLFSAVDPVTVGASKRASELATDVGERLLRMHMTSAEDKNRVRSIAEGLNKSFFAHGDAVSRTRAKELQLRIADSNPELEKLIWDAYLGIEEYMSFRTSFNPLQHYLANGGANALVSPSPLILPPNAPPQLVGQLWGQVAQNALQALAQPSVEVPFSLINAIIESPRLCSECKSEGTLTAARITGGEIHLTATDRQAGWRKVQISTGVNP